MKDINDHEDILTPEEIEEILQELEKLEEKNRQAESSIDKEVTHANNKSGTVR